MQERGSAIQNEHYTTRREGLVFLPENGSFGMRKNNQPDPLATDIWPEDNAVTDADTLLLFWWGLRREERFCGAYSAKW